MNQIKVDSEVLGKIDNIFKNSFKEIIDIIKKNPSIWELHHTIESARLLSKQLNDFSIKINNKIQEVQHKIDKIESLPHEIRAKQKLYVNVYKNKKSHLESLIKRIDHTLSSVSSLEMNLSANLDKYNNLLFYANMNSQNIVNATLKKLTKIKITTQEYNSIYLNTSSPSNNYKKTVPSEQKKPINLQKSEYYINSLKIKIFSNAHKIIVDFFNDNDEKIGTIKLKLKSNSLGIILNNTSFFQNEKKSIFQLIFDFAKDNNIKQLYAWVDEQIICDFKDYGFVIDGKIIQDNGAEMIKNL